MSQAILLPVLVFTAIVVALSAVVLAASAWLSPSGVVTVTVNRHRRLQVAAGSRLLWALSEHDIILPAACGGRGTCGQCRVRVAEGAGQLLPNEAALISPRDADRGARLACSLSVFEDLDVTVPAELLAVKRIRASVRSNRNIAPLLTELILDLPEGQPLDFEAGEYVLLEAPPYAAAFRDFDIDPDFREEWQRYGLLELKSESSEPVSRAYSLANAPHDGNEAMLLVRIATAPPNAPYGTPPGLVSSYIFSLQPGDAVTISGPFGEFHATESQRDMVMLAGGVGIAPIRSIILDQLARGTMRRISLWYGARDARDLCYQDEFDELARDHENFQWHAVLSSPRAGSGWTGLTGFVHAVVLREYLQRHPEPEALEYYLCGPPLMSAAVLDVLDELGVERDSVFYDEFGSQ
jgi:Na+-transporting NADH:ubiquinone oxidoreductase subunit F